MFALVKQMRIGGEEKILATLDANYNTISGINLTPKMKADCKQANNGIIYTDANYTVSILAGRYITG
jgi:hypothetical protein